MKKNLSEKDFTAQVIQLAKLFGWRVAHFRSVPIRRANGQIYYATPVQGDGAGFPDLILVKPPRLIVAELKVGKNKLEAEQEIWLAAMRGVGAEVFEWRPEAWADIERVLRAA